MHVISFDLMQTFTFATLLLLIGFVLCRKITFLYKYSIPAPVVGGLVFAFVNLAMREAGLSFHFDTTLQDPFMFAFFTTVGFGASIKLLKKGGMQLVYFLGIASVLVILQNVVSLALGCLTGGNPLHALLAGSITMTGGMGTGATFAHYFIDQYNLPSAMELAMAAATFGIVSGSLVGGPVTRRLILRYRLETPNKDWEAAPAAAETAAEQSTGEVPAEIEAIAYEPAEPATTEGIIVTMLQIGFCVAMGTIIYELFLKMDIMVPTYLFALFMGIVVRNVSEFTHLYKVNMRLVGVIGDIALSLFLAIALMSLELWKLVDLAVPMLIVLTGQVVLMVAFAYFVTFNLIGRDYDAAVLAAGHIGFGLGATPNAMTNMQTITSKYGPSPKAMFLVPIVGAFFIDVVNAFVIQAFVSFVM